MHERLLARKQQTEDNAKSCAAIRVSERAPCPQERAAYCARRRASPRGVCWAGACDGPVRARVGMRVCMDVCVRARARACVCGAQLSEQRYDTAAARVTVVDAEPLKALSDPTLRLPLRPRPLPPASTRTCAQYARVPYLLSPGRHMLPSAAPHACLRARGAFVARARGRMHVQAGRRARHGTARLCVFVCLRVLACSARRTRSSHSSSRRMRPSACRTTRSTARPLVTIGRAVLRVLTGAVRPVPA